MHPALSVIFFTVASGAGYGLFILLALSHLLGLVKMDMSTVLIGGVLALGLISAGLLSSTFHLANPKNAWRSFFRFRTSWLSREAVFAVLFYPFAVLYLGGVWLKDGGSNGFVLFLGLAAVLLAVVTVFSTGMIYGCLKTIRQWNTALTPANYILLGLASGGVLLAVLLIVSGGQAGTVAWLSGTLLLLAALTKAVYYFWVKTVIGPTINTATGFTRARVRLLDTGHTAGTFLTDEFGYQADPGLLRSLKVVVFVCGFALPLLFVWSLSMGYAGPGVAILAVISTFLGLGVERWLFFAEARHVVNLYHGAQHT